MRILRENGAWPHFIIHFIIQTIIYTAKGALDKSSPYKDATNNGARPHLIDPIYLTGSIYMALTPA